MAGGAVGLLPDIQSTGVDASYSFGFALRCATLRVAGVTTRRLAGVTTRSLAGVTTRSLAGVTTRSVVQLSLLTQFFWLDRALE